MDGVHSVIAGITEAGSILMPVARWRRSTTRGDLVVHVARWFGSALLIDVESEEVDADTVSSTVLLYYGLGSWAGAASPVEEPIYEDEKLVGWRMELRTQPELSIQLDDEFELVMSVEWTVGGDNDRRSATTPLAVRLNSRTRRPLDEHLQRLDAIHALLSLAHKKPVVATRGFARLAPDSRHQAQLWDRTMVDDTVDPGTNSFPVFELFHMSQLDGVAAWIRMCLDHSRAVTPIVQHRLSPNQRPEAMLLSTAAALEYWASSHARTHAWAKGIKKWQVPHQAAMTVSPSFDSWVGGTERWADQFTHAYNRLKHDHVTVDARLVSAVELAGRWLLTASILDECAGSTDVSESIFTRGLAYPVGRDLREILDAAPDVPAPGYRRIRTARPGSTSSCDET